MRLALLLALLAACKATPPGSAAPPRSPMPAPPAASPRLACIDAELEAKQLNQFGDPPGTVYAGGTPLFDERSGKVTDRLAHLLAKHPELAKGCPSR